MSLGIIDLHLVVPPGIFLHPLTTPYSTPTILGLHPQLPKLAVVYCPVDSKQQQYR